MRGGLGLVRVVRVVRHHRRDVQLLADLDQAVADAALDLQPVVHQLEEVVVLAEDVLEGGGGLQRLVELAEPQPGLDLAGRAARRAHHAVGVLGEQLLVHPGVLEDEALGVGAARQLEHVVQAGLVARPQRHVVDQAAAGDVIALLARLAPLDLLLVVAGLGRHVRLDADDRGDPGGRRLLVEVVGAVHVAVVGHRDRRHLLPADLFEHLLQPGRSVEHGVLRMNMQVNERVGHACCASCSSHATARAPVARGGGIGPGGRSSTRRGRREDAVLRA